MGGKTVITLQIAAEEVKDWDLPARAARGAYTGRRIDREHLVLDILLLIDELVRELPHLRIEDVSEKKTSDKIVIDLQIAAEEIEDLAELFEEEIGGAEVMHAVHTC